MRPDLLGTLNIRPDVRRLDVEDALLLVRLRREALETEPRAFAASVTDDVGLVIESVQTFLRTPDTQAVYGAFDGHELVGMIGVVRSTRLKQSHKAMIWGMYVQPAFRRRGIARELLNAAIAQARAWSLDQLQLTVAESAQPAKHLYEAAGFRVWGTEPRALQWNGHFITEHHLALALGESA